jgi:hypothetical protein
MDHIVNPSQGMNRRNDRLAPLQFLATNASIVERRPTVTGLQAAA